MRSARRLAVASLWSTVWLAACGDTKPKVPASLNKLSDNQTAAAGTVVKNPPSVSVLDADGKGVSGITVTFTVASGGGSLAGAATTTTNSAGIATAGAWTLGTQVGTNTIVASAANVPGSPVTLTAIAVAGPPATLAKVGADPVCVAAGGIVDSITVRVTDQFSNPVGGAAVSFAVTGGGSAASVVLTNSAGIAQARWIMGPTPGTTNTATASVGGLAATVSFSTLTRAPVAAVRLAPAVSVIDSAASAAPAYSAMDSQGSQVQCAPITLTARSPSAVTISGSSVTGAHAGQTFVVAASPDNPAAKDSALVIVANTGSPVVLTSIPRFDLKTDTTLSVSVIIDMHSSGQRVGAATLQVIWDPTVLIFQSSASGTGTNVPAVTSNESGAVSGTITMTFADPNGFSNQVEVRKLNFAAASTAGRIGTLTLTALDLISTTATDLRLKTVTSFYPLRTR